MQPWSRGERMTSVTDGKPPTSKVWQLCDTCIAAMDPPIAGVTLKSQETLFEDEHSTTKGQAHT